jgi:hypothetical protein
MPSSRKYDTTSSPDNENNNKQNGQKTQKIRKNRIKWTEELHALFVEAYYKLGEHGLPFGNFRSFINENEIYKFFILILLAVPSEITKEMDVVGLTRENVASHLQVKSQKF